MKNTKRTGKILVLTLLILVVFTLVYLKITYDASFSRVDKKDEKYTGYLRYSDVNQYARVDVAFTSGNNMLHGYMYGPENTKGLVVISHGLGFGAENYLSETLYFVDKGWCVFAFDNTGTHTSEGIRTIGPSQSLVDLRAALTYISEDDTLKDLSIMLYGHSWGAYAVCAILADDFAIDAVVSIAGFNSPNGTIERADVQRTRGGFTNCVPFSLDISEHAFW